jgi:hypothetical protein
MTMIIIIKPFFHYFLQRCDKDLFHFSAGGRIPFVPRSKQKDGILRERIGGRVARWFVFQPKITIWVNFGGPYIYRKMFIDFMAIWNILWRFGIFCDHLILHLVHFWVLVSCTKRKIWQP